jgi:hypothetical protein
MEIRTDYRQYLGHETWSEMSLAGRHNRAQVASWTSRWGNHAWTIIAGESDHITFYRPRHSGLVFCLALNNALGYVGLEEYDESMNAPTDRSIFISGDDYLEYERLQPITIAKRLLEVLCD